MSDQDSKLRVNEHPSESLAKQLDDDDQARVDAYLAKPQHQVHRKPFRPWLMMGIIAIVMTILSFLSYGIAWYHGVV